VRCRPLKTVLTDACNARRTHNLKERPRELRTVRCPFGLSTERSAEITRKTTALSGSTPGWSSRRNTKADTNHPGHLLHSHWAGDLLSLNRHFNGIFYCRKQGDEELEIDKK
jgi:hypothetical protein